MSAAARVMIVLFVSFVLFVTFVGTSFSSWTSARAGAIEGAKARALNTLNDHRRFRAYYTKTVVAKVKASKALKISFDHDGRRDTIPLPDTLIHDLSYLSQQDEAGTRLNLFSKYPWPNRAGRALDPFQSSALDMVERDPNNPYVSVEELEGVPMVRVAIADKMVAEACVSCHNNRAGTPKNDWKLGDVRGVLEVSLPIKAELDAAAGSGMTGVVLSILALCLTVPLIAIGCLRRDSDTSQKEAPNIVRESAGERLARLEQEMAEIRRKLD